MLSPLMRFAEMTSLFFSEIMKFWIKANYPCCSR